MNTFLSVISMLLNVVHPTPALAVQPPAVVAKPQSIVQKIVPAPVVAPVAKVPAKKLALVPFYSQFSDITSPTWKKQGCGITSLAMVIGYYKQSSVSVDSLLAEGITAGAYSDAGWTYSGLISVASKHGMQGSSFDLASSGMTSAYGQFTKALATGPVIASVHYKFDPKSTIPHLVVINSIKDGVVYYNDPAAATGQLQIPVDTFTKAWKMRYIVIRPQATA